MRNTGKLFVSVFHFHPRYQVGETFLNLVVEEVGLCRVETDFYHVVQLSTVVNQVHFE